MKTMLAVAVLLNATAAGAETVAPTELTTLGDSTITVTVWPFLNEEELTLLRLVATNPDALTLFVPDGSGHAALAVSPDDGFIRGGVPVESAVALSGYAGAETARAETLAACAAKKAGAADCVVVLEVMPAP
jgi:hypothetical protein